MLSMQQRGTPMDTQPARQSAADKRPSQGGILDGRTRRARRRRELILAYSNALGGDAVLTEGQRADIRKAAELIALSEDCRALALQQGPGGAVAISAMVRLESAASRAVRALYLPPPGSAAPVQSITEYWAGRHAAAPEEAEE
jgi:hypothetical protein